MVGIDRSPATLLVTGGTGSFGSTVARRLLAQDAVGELRILSRDEAKQDDLRRWLADPRARNGVPHEVLIEEAKHFDDALIVVGNRRMQGPGRLLGSVANSVAHNAPCDVYVVKTT